MEHHELLPHLFRSEYRKIVAVLTKRFGFDNMETAEDITSDTFLTAAQTWGLEGTPENPTAWLYAVAKNKTKNQLLRMSLFDARVSAEIRRNTSHVPEQEIDLSPRNINDSQLQMMFAICHPAIPADSQVGLSLRILCGFGIDEIADAFLTSKDTINKRLFRAREKLRQEKISIELPVNIEDRLETVLTTIYLLFNEGYYSASQNKTLRRDLCLEAMRLCHMLIENPGTNKPQVNALLSLMCFHVSRFDARIGRDGELILYDDQDRTLWNADLVSKGGYFLSQAASGGVLSRYHLEAAIAYWHTQKWETQEKWENILQLYDQLLELGDSPVAGMNRIFALSKVRGKKAAIVEVEKLNFTDSHFFWVLLGELYTDEDNDRAKQSFQHALVLAKSQTEKAAIQRKIDKLDSI